MCGIGGILSPGREDEIRPLLPLLSDSLEHRGPDGFGQFQKGPLGLIHRRLAVIDLSEGGRQPHIDQKRGNAISYNGECYNYKELRKDLSSRGEVFETLSDTEVVLKGIGRDGLDFVSKINGQFAFAFWSEKDQELWLVRDRLGIKPLYFHNDGQQFIFSSEVEPLLQAGVTRSLNEASFVQFLRYRYSPGTETLFAGIKKVEPGSILKVNKRLEISPRHYWKIEDFKEDLDTDYSQHRDEIFNQLQKSVTARLTADVPVATYLSGGIDSSSVAALSQDHVKKAFCYKAAGGLDESTQAETFSKIIGLPLDMVEDNPRNQSIVDNYKKCVQALGEPLGDSIIWPTYRLAEQVAKSFKVVTSGEGSDEIFAGYVHHLVLHNLSLVPRHMRKGLNSALHLGNFPLINRGLEFLKLYPQNPGQDGFQRLQSLLADKTWSGQSIIGLTQLFSDAEIINLTERDAGQTPSPIVEYFHQLEDRSLLTRVIKTDLKFWTPDYTLQRIDRLHMKHGVEARTPFLDHKLVERALQIPARYKVRGLTRKRIFRDSIKFHKVLPQSLSRRPKTPFFMSPEQTYGIAYQNALQEVLLDSSILQAGLFERSKIESLLFKKPPSLKASKQLMALFIFSLWYSSVFSA